MEDILIRFWTDLVGRLTGPMTFRLILQPAMAMVYAVRDGVRDARNGRPAYFWSVLAHSGDRGPLLTEGAKAVARVITLGAVMDATYQIIALKWIYPLELVVVVLALAFVPYLLMRGPANRIARLWMPRAKGAVAMNERTPPPGTPAG